MSQALSSRSYPWGASTATLTVSSWKRDNEGVGSYVYQAAGLAPVLTIVFPNGRDSGLQWSTILDIIEKHMLDHTSVDAWSPRNTTKSTALRQAIAGFNVGSGAVSVGLALLFDGQFGPVSAG